MIREWFLGNTYEFGAGRQTLQDGICASSAGSACEKMA